MRPAQVCQALLCALEASEGRRRRRKRDTTPDAIGLALKRELLESAVRDDPDPDRFEEWLLRYCASRDHRAGSGAVTATAQSVLEEWRLAQLVPEFKLWLDRGAPSDDASAGPGKPA